ncbi:hypothetical protein ACFV7Q_27895 [Streptomyces sp. NPDC059851]|uniref:hypothetical protein n=1 Tax=Streptomyces sp. NPDC059851 TaxID=3346971 RepID=UPI00366567C2
MGTTPGPARARHHGVASREELLLHRNNPRRDARDTHDDYGYEVTGYPAGWSVAAARTAITTDTSALLRLLGDSDPTIRVLCRRCMLHPEEPDPEAVFWDSPF